MKRIAFFGIVLLLVALTAVGCASEPGQWELKWDKTGDSSLNNTINWRSGSEGSGGNGLF
ncbi:MAG: hypothetical protein ACOYNZ_08240 [Rhodoferax sp.]